LGNTVLHSIDFKIILSDARFLQNLETELPCDCFAYSLFNPFTWRCLSSSCLEEAWYP